ncbi:hypothetical protein ACFYNO_07445 [Kitasatospora sp. NPDC006697]|uniref:hypothetical protein n=1 Tax=Kitasatospora sp. NPDC006697 TaxID=3364020 RepID=UPI0036869CC1
MTSPANQHQTVLDQISSAVQSLNNTLQSLPGKAREAADQWWMPPQLGSILVGSAETIAWCGREFLQTVVECLEGSAAPLIMIANAYEWTDIHGIATTVAGEIQPSTLGSTGNWQGPAATAYTKSIAPQSSAATAIAGIAEKTSSSLYTCSAAGIAFYTAVLTVVAKFQVVLTALIVTFFTDIGAIPAAMDAVTETAEDSATLKVLVLALVAFLGAQATEMGTLHDKAGDNSNFPGGHWPVAVKAS